MKKFYYIVGAFVTAAAIFTFFAVMLKKIKVSLSIEGIDEELDENENEDITLTIEDDDEKDEKDEKDGDEIMNEEIETMLNDDSDEL